MPPESFEGLVSPAWDLWSLGVILLWALTGRVPYPETSQLQLSRMIAAGEQEIPTGLPAPFGTIVRGCLIKDHRLRWTAEHVLMTLRSPRAAEEQRSTPEPAAQAAAWKREAAEHARAGRWEQALALLAQVQQFDPADREIGQLIANVDAERARRRGHREGRRGRK